MASWGKEGSKSRQIAPQDVPFAASIPTKSRLWIEIMCFRFGDGGMKPAASCPPIVWVRAGFRSVSQSLYFVNKLMIFTRLKKLLAGGRCPFLVANV